MRAPLGSRGALLGDLGISLGAALGGRQRRSRIDMRGRGRWPSAGATLDLDFVNQQGYAYGQGIGRIQDLVTISGGAGGTVVGPSGLIVSASAPRFDYDPLTLACNGLLIESQQTNLLASSTGFVASWVTNGDVGWADNAGTSPSGSNDATASTATGTRYLNAAVTGGVTYCYSKYVKQKDGTAAYSIYVDGAGRVPSVVATFNFGSESFSSIDPDVTGVGSEKLANGWFRVWITFVASATGAVACHVYGYGAGPVYAWGAQIEAGSSPTTYVPTVAASVTRTVDSARITGAKFSDWFNPLAGTLLLAHNYDVSAAVFANNRGALGLLTDGGAYRAIVYNGSGFAGTIYVINAAGVQQLYAAGESASDAFVITALAYDAGNYAACVDGGAVSAASGDAVMPDVSRIALGSVSIGAGALNGHLERLRYWPRRLSNGELQELTR